MKKDFYNNLPKKRMATGILVPYENKFLVVKPGYKEMWSVPGGIIEHNESPLDCAIREAKEEIGLDLEITNLLGIDYTEHENHEHGENLQFTFLSKPLTDKLIGQIIIDNNEIIDYRFVPANELKNILSSKLAKRICTIIQNNNFSQTLYLHNGGLVLPR